MVNQIDPGLGRGAGRSRAAGVDCDLDAVPVRLIDDGRHLVLGDCLRVAPGVVGELDQIDAAAALLPRLENKGLPGITQDARCVGRVALKPRIGVGVEDAAVITESTGGDNHARPFQHAAAKRVAYDYIGEPFTARDGNARDAGIQDLAEHAGRPQRAELGALRVFDAGQRALV